MNRPRMKGWKVWGILKSRFILEKYTQWSAHKWRVGRFAAFWKFIHFRKIRDETRRNEGSDAFWHFEKLIHFRNKYTMKRPQMKGRTLCRILKNRFILDTNTQRSAHKWRGGRFAAFWKNYPILFNYIEKWNLYENLKAVLHWERKFSALEKMEYKQKYFFKNWAPRIWGGGQFAAFYKNDVNFENIVYYSEKNEFFRISYFKNIH